MGQKVIHHRTPEFERLLKGSWAGLQHVFGTKQSVQILCGTGTAAMEAAVTNTLSPGSSIVVVTAGKFGERWAEIASQYGVQVHRFEVPWGEALSVDAFARELEKHTKLDAVMWQACETSTATLFPVQEMAQRVRKIHPEALCLVDAITAVGCTPLPMDEWDLDVIVGGSQKAFMLPTGLSFIALSERAWKHQDKFNGSPQINKFYFDLKAERQANLKGETRFSTPTPLIVGLHLVLEQMQSVGLTQVHQRCEALAQATRMAGTQLGLSVFSKSPSPSVTGLEVGLARDSAQCRDWLERERQITIMGGQDQLKGRLLRVGHMGDIQDDDMIALFRALGEYFNVDFAPFEKDMSKQLQRTRPLFA